MPRAENIGKLTELAESFLTSIRSAAKAMSEDNSDVSTNEGVRLLNETSLRASEFTAAAASSPDLAESVAASPAIAALSLVSEDLAKISTESPALAELAIASPEVARIAAKFPKMGALAVASPALVTQIENALQKSKD